MNPSTVHSTTRWPNSRSAIDAASGVSTAVRDGVDFSHILTLTDRFGTLEHADHAVGRPEHGYCTDDMARLLVVTTREPRPSGAVKGLARDALRFVADAQGVTGRIRNRRSVDGRWHGRRTVEDCWGRSVWGFGTAAAHRDGWLGQHALAYFEHGAQQRSPWPRAMAFAALGAAAVVATHPRHYRSLALLAAAADIIGQPGEDAEWPWPEARLTYANAVLPDAMIAIGHALDRPTLVADGLDLLAWLLERETSNGHLSVTPAGGADRDDRPPGFDQQPIEVATLADACVRACGVSDDPRWARGVAAAVAWFDGDNDAGAVMWDPSTGGGFDGLEARGPNRNQGAESTLAAISTYQQARTLAGSSR